MMKLGVLLGVLTIVLLLAFVARGNGIIKSLMMVCSNFGFGFGSLYLLNLASTTSGFAIPINSLSLATSGVLGLPGTMLSAALQIVLPI